MLETPAPLILLMSVCTTLSPVGVGCYDNGTAVAESSVQRQLMSLYCVTVTQTRRAAAKEASLTCCGNHQR